MNVMTTDLNLARKWRPKTFETVVGQDVPVRMLKNSLYLKKYFPVYLFAGQRGCGKTSTARIFAAAINCQQLLSFQENPTVTSIPCLTCNSCLAMSKGQHPDFIEIDAASHTGVDNVRQIIDSSSYMPLSGQKKIYLIDEAHMLSKAAFNAFLKLLEEPPASVLFILATTEVIKIPQTVLSRCFQVIFGPLEAIALKEHLRTLCTQEQITIDDAALDIILQETEGSARDAINLLERIRFAGSNITEQMMLQLLGKIGPHTLFAIFEPILDQQPQKLLEVILEHHVENLSAQGIWEMLVQLCRAMVWVKYGVTQIQPQFKDHLDTLHNFAQKCSVNRLQALLQLLWAQEEIFLRTSKKQMFLEMVLLQMCEQVNITDLEELLKTCKSSGPLKSGSGTIAQPIQKKTESAPLPPKQVTEFNKISQTQESVPTKSPEKPLEQNDSWSAILNDLEQKDQLLHSIFAQSRFLGLEADINLFKIQLSSNSKFFKEKLEESKPVWLPIVKTHLPNFTDFHFLAAEPQPAASDQKKSSYVTSALSNSQSAPPRPSERPIAAATRPSGSSWENKTPSSNLLGEAVNIKDAAQWPVANLIVSHFPGKIRKNKVFS